MGSMSSDLFRGDKNTSDWTLARRALLEAVVILMRLDRFDIMPYERGRTFRQRWDCGRAWGGAARMTAGGALSAA